MREANACERTHVVRIVDQIHLVNMIKEGCGNKSVLLILLIYYLKKSQKSNLSLENKNLKWGGGMIMK